MRPDNAATLSQDDRRPRFIIKEVLWESAIASPGCAGPTPQQRTSSSALLLEIRGCFAGVSTPRQRAKCFQAKGAEISSTQGKKVEAFRL